MIEDEGLGVLGWRDVPCDNRTLGDIARSAEPVIRQIFIAGNGLVDEQLERRLFRARKRTERRARVELGITPDAFYIPSMSCKTICYKGMFLAPQLFDYYADLANPDMTTALAVVHQRYSTNTFPSWRLAQAFPHDRPQRRNQYAPRQSEPIDGLRKVDEQSCIGECRGMQGPSNLFPIIEPGGSDSAAFDNCMELLVRAGRSAPHALMMMIPEAFGPAYHISLDKQAFYEYHGSILDPWDGPAAMVFTDGRLVGGTLDRNGLRPADTC